jgi:hypothetical protein
MSPEPVGRAGTGIFGAITCQRQHHLTGGRDIAESRTGILDGADAYTDVHCSGSPANGRQDTPWAPHRTGRRTSVSPIQ